MESYIESGTFFERTSRIALLSRLLRSDKYLPSAIVHLRMVPLRMFLFLSESCCIMGFQRGLFSETTLVGVQRIVISVEPGTRKLQSRTKADYILWWRAEWNVFSSRRHRKRNINYGNLFATKP